MFSILNRVLVRSRALCSALHSTALPGIALATLLVLPTVAAAQPTLDWLGHLSSTGRNIGHGIGFDDAGNLYLAGGVEGSTTLNETGCPGDLPIVATGRNTAYVVKLTPTGNPADPYTCAWAREFDGNNREDVTAMVVDGDGNTYTVGTYVGNADFDPTDGQTDPSVSNSIDMFLIKLDTNGNVVWHHTLGNFRDDRIFGVTVADDDDADSDVDVYVTGWFQGTVDFDPGVGSASFTSSLPPGCIAGRGCNSSPFVARYDDDGSLDWVRAFSNSTGRMEDVEVDSAGHVFLVGSFSHTLMDVDPDPAVTVNLDPNATGFVVQLDPDGDFVNGYPLAIRTGGGGITHKDIEVDDAGNVWTAGYISAPDPMDLDMASGGTQQAVSTAGHDPFLLKFDGAGKVLWYAQPIPGGTDSEIIQGLTVDGAGNAISVGYFAGRFGTTLDFDPANTDPSDPLLFTAVNWQDMFLWVVDGNGATVDAVHVPGDPGASIQPFEVLHDDAGGVYVTGRFGGTVDFDPAGTSPVASSLTAPAFTDVFAARYGGFGGDPDLVAYAALDENAGVIADFGQGLSGDLGGGATWFDYGQQGSAVEFDGSTGYIEVVDAGSSPLDVTTLTVAAWVRPDAVGSGTQSLVSKDDAYELELGRNFPYDTWELRIDNGSPGTADTPVQEGVWQHLAATWDGSTIRYYRNGQPDGSVAHAAAIDPMTNENLGIGARPTAAASGGPTYFFEGAMDEVRVYSRVLEGAEIQALFDDSVTDVAAPARSNGSPDGVAATAPVTLGLDTDETAHCKFGEVATGTRYADLPSAFANTDASSHDSSFTPAGSTALVRVRCRDLYGNTNTTDFNIGVGIGTSDVSGDLQGEWLFEEGTGCTTADLINAQTGDLSNSLGTCDASDDSPQWLANEADAIPGPCFSGQCLAFDGNDKVSVTTVDAIRVLPQELTVSAWVRHDAISGTFSLVADLRGTDVDSGLQALGFALALDPSGKGYFRVRGTTVIGPTDLDDGQWHHLVGVWRVGSVGVGSTRLYVDGVLDKALNEGSASYNLAATTQLQIGHRFNAGETMHNFKGELDTVSVYDRELSDLEVFDLYLATRP